MIHMIDTPSPFATVEEWKSYLQSLLQIIPQTPDILALINEAKDMIKAIENG